MARSTGRRAALGALVALAAAVSAPEAFAIVPAKVVRSGDGQLTVSIPRGALARPTNVRIRALPRAQWPAELRGANVRAGARVYSLEPHGLTFRRAVTVTRRLAGIDVASGVPGMLLTTRGARGRWSRLGNVRTRVNGRTLVVSGTTTHFSPLVTLSTGASIDFRPEAVTALVGEEWPAEILPQNATILDVDWDVSGAVDFSDEEPFFFCERAGRGEFFAEVDYQVVNPSPLLVRLAGTNRIRGAVEVGGLATCTTQLLVTLTAACVVVEHSAFGAFPSFMRWVFIFAALGLPVNPVLQLQVGGANNDVAANVPIGSNGRAEVVLGISAFGPKPVQLASVNGQNVTSQVQAKVGTPTVGPNEGTIAGSC